MFSAVFTTGGFQDTDWYIDSGASIHLTTKRDWLQNERSPDIAEIVANKKKIPVHSAGDVQIKTDLNQSILLKDVQYVPDLTTNLLLGKIIKN